MKIIASIFVLGICTIVCYGATPSPTTQSGAMSYSWLNNIETKVYDATNTTDAEIFNQNALTTVPGSPTGVSFENVVFGPGTTNVTAYVYGLTVDGDRLIEVYKRTLNATVVS